MRFLSLLAVLLLLCPAPARAAGEGIAAVVNADAITSSDVNERLKLIGASTGIIRNQEMMEKLRPQVVDMLVDESLKMQAARQAGVKVSPTEIEAGFTEIAKNNNVSADAFRQMISRAGINPGTMRDQIEAQIAWGKVVQARIRPRIEVTDGDIDAELAKLRGKLGQNQYRLSQIVMPVNNPKKENDLRNFIGRLGEQLKAEPENFAKAAQQFSQAPGAKQGGDIGWMEKTQLPVELASLVEAMDGGAVAGPVKAQNAYYLLLLKEKRVLTEEMLPGREDILQKVGLQRMERASRRYMLDLRATAFIETRA
jgi:peptidyl-prolyl cis-trans isomerase SurA